MIISIILFFLSDNSLSPGRSGHIFIFAIKLHFMIISVSSYLSTSASVKELPLKLYLSFKSSSLIYFMVLFYSFKCLIQILDNIIYILCTNGKTNGVRFNSLIQKFLLCALAVCGSCRMDDQRFYICHICKK